MKYPRIVQLDSPKLKDLIVQKNDWVLAGRKVSGEIDLIVEAQKSTEKKLMVEEAKVDIKDLQTKGDNLLTQIDALMKDLQATKQEIFDRMKIYTSQSIRDEYETLEKQKKAKENELYKIGHKVQKVKDKILPLVQKIAQPYLEDEFEDFSTTRLDKKGNPVLEIFNHKEDWISNFRKKGK